MRNRSRLMAGLATAAAAVFLMTGCSSVPHEGDGDERLTVYATTGYLADAVANIAPDASVTTMVGPGGNPHTYQPSTRDIEKIQSVDVVLWNGLYLEAQMIELLKSRGDRQLEVGDKLPKELLLSWPETDDEGNTLHDPHVWNSPEAWSLVVGYVADKLSEIDPENAADYQTNVTNYQAEIAEAAADVEKLLASVPEPRILITGHDAFNYFGHTYNLAVYATDFVSTEAALSAGELSELARMIADNQIPMIFQDNQANPQAITSLREAVRALGWNVEIASEELYADSLGADPGVDTYLGVFRHNAQSVADALGEETQ